MAIDVEDYSLWLLSIRIFNSKIEIKYYMLFLSGENDIPFCVSGKIALFERYKFLELLQNKYNININERNLLKEIDLDIDIFDIKRIVENCKEDKFSSLINALNIYLDCIKYIKVEIPEFFKNPLYNIANYMTYSNDIGSYWDESIYSKTDIINAFAWLHGILIYNSIINPVTDNLLDK